MGCKLNALLDSDRDVRFSICKIHVGIVPWRLLPITLKTFKKERRVINSVRSVEVSWLESRVGGVIITHGLVVLNYCQ
jgi:hypothetical protein